MCLYQKGTKGSCYVLYSSLIDILPKSGNINVLGILKLQSFWQFNAIVYFEIIVEVLFSCIVLFFAPQFVFLYYSQTSDSRLNILSTLELKYLKLIHKYIGKCFSSALREVPFCLFSIIEKRLLTNSAIECCILYYCTCLATLCFCC